MSLTIAEASERTGVSAHALRYYERIDLIDPIPRTPGGQRIYGEGDITRIVFLSRMRATGMPIEALRRYVDLIREGQHTSPQRRASLEAHRAEVVANIRMLNEALAILDERSRTTASGRRTDDPSEPPITVPRSQPW